MSDAADYFMAYARSATMRATWVRFKESATHCCAHLPSTGEGSCIHIQYRTSGGFSGGASSRTICVGLDNVFLLFKSHGRCRLYFGFVAIECHRVRLQQPLTLRNAVASASLRRSPRSYCRRM